MALIAIEIEACAPEALALPTAELRWYLTGRHTHGELVRIEGAPDAVEAFVRLHWGDDEFECPNGVQSFSPEEFFQAYGVPRARWTYVWETTDGPSLGALYVSEEAAMVGAFAEWCSHFGGTLGGYDEGTRDEFDRMYADSGDIWITTLEEA